MVATLMGFEHVFIQGVDLPLDFIEENKKYKLFWLPKSKRR